MAAAPDAVVVGTYLPSPLRGAPLLSEIRWPRLRQLHSKAFSSLRVVRAKECVLQLCAAGDG